MENIIAESIELGVNSFIHPSAIIKGINGKAKSVKIGDNTYIGERVQIICDEFQIGDYSKVHHDTNIHGYKPCIIGHNAWIGQYCIIDCIGGTTIGNNCGIGAHSQLWSHIKYGDTLEGCRFLSEKALSIGNDVWFVGHCIVSPITANDKSMAMVGSVITKDMELNNIYAGSPAKSISDKIGFQFLDINHEDKFMIMSNYLKEFSSSHTNLRIVLKDEEVNFENNVTYFSIESRRYKKLRSNNEIEFMKFLLPSKAKFVPFV